MMKSWSQLEALPVQRPFPDQELDPKSIGSISSAVVRWQSLRCALPIQVPFRKRTGEHLAQIPAGGRRL
jgi:hypothetical protein